MADWIVGGIVFAALCTAAWHVVRNHLKGGCGGCGGCRQSYGGDRDYNRKTGR
ncbi:MAG: FeoB-associated Cys-rich membrane protein, partial [Lentisphaeria bacterium]|nr:FeoB-associated Cys-rich membrane protein [Lentisphaeria bacterium]